MKGVRRACRVLGVGIRNERENSLKERRPSTGFASACLEKVQRATLSTVQLLSKLGCSACKGNVCEGVRRRPVKL